MINSQRIILEYKKWLFKKLNFFENFSYEDVYSEYSYFCLIKTNIKFWFFYNKEDGDDFFRFGRNRDGQFLKLLGREQNDLIKSPIQQIFAQNFLTKCSNSLFRV